MRFRASIRKVRNSCSATGPSDLSPVISHSKSMMLWRRVVPETWWENSNHDSRSCHGSMRFVSENIDLANREPSRRDRVVKCSASK